MTEYVALATAYLLGSIPFGLLISWLLGGPDLRRTGSGNIGATNALRSGGLVAGLSTLALDVGKGAAGYLLAARIAGPPEGWSPWVAGAIVTAPVLGHCLPVWLRFRGGKGVATAGGVLAVSAPGVLGVAATAFLALAVPTRYVSLGSIGAAVAAAIAAIWFEGVSSFSAGIVVVALVVLVRHRENISRLSGGRESRLGRGAGGEGHGT